eukprot:TRINITY_DN1861_c1_g1_i6.p4 TRINITY_DN1861_c1_g1~~TRINITY_DN1861_c1_g1_i6.p4  ORF type:complete len:233 (+),score=-22.67 TRINITY_DN1861_c1_g1_i6:1416-2114(+)
MLLLQHSIDQNKYYCKSKIILLNERYIKLTDQISDKNIVYSFYKIIKNKIDPHKQQQQPTNEHRKQKQMVKMQIQLYIVWRFIITVKNSILQTLYNIHICNANHEKKILFQNTLLIYTQVYQYVRTYLNIYTCIRQQIHKCCILGIYLPFICLQHDKSTKHKAVSTTKYNCDVLPNDLNYQHKVLFQKDVCYMIKIRKKIQDTIQNKSIFNYDQLIIRDYCYGILSGLMDLY